MAYATVADLIARFDRRDIQALVSDTQFQVELMELGENAALLAALDDASGIIDAALLKANRYSTDDLNGLTGNSLALLKRICCAQVMVLLLERRPDRDPERLEAQTNLAESYLKRISKGEDVFDLEPVKEAGLPETVGPTLVDLDNLNMPSFRSRGHYYPNVRLPFNR